MCVEICENMVSLYGRVQGERVRMRLHLFYNDGCVDCNAIPDFIVVRGRVGYVVVQSAGHIFRRPVEEVNTNLDCLTIYANG